MNFRKMLFIKYGLFFIFLSAITVFLLLWILRVDNKPLLNMVIAYFLNQPI